MFHGLEESYRRKLLGQELGILLVIAGFALLVKFVIFFLSIKTAMSFSLPNAENWQDFSLAYVPAVNTFKNGLLPYGDFYYPYPPLFLYALTLFSYLPLPSWSSALPLVLGDALTVIPVYLIAREFVSERYSVLISVLFVLAPTSLYYADYLWLNPSLTTLFLMLSIYFLIKRHYDLGGVTLALSAGFKQTALIALPIILLILWRRSGRTQALRYLFVTASMCFLLSLPFIVMTPALYLDSIFRVPFGMWPQVPTNYFNIATGTGTPISINTLNAITAKWQLVVSGINSPVTLALPIFIFLLPSAVSGIYVGSNLFGILIWSILIASYALVLYKTLRNKEIEERDLPRYVLYAMLVLLTFYPLYKYYVVGIVPILALLVRSKRDALALVAFNFALMFIPRYLSSWILLIALLWLFRAHFHRKKYFTYSLVASTVFLIAFVPFIATSSVVSPYEPAQLPVPTCSNFGLITISTTETFKESCVLLPGAIVNESSYIQSSSGAHASFVAVSNTDLPFDVQIKDNTNGVVLDQKDGVTYLNSSVNLSYGNSYSLIIKNDADKNNTITLSSEIGLG